MFDRFSSTDVLAWSGRLVVAAFIVHAIRGSLRAWRAEKEASRKIRRDRLRPLKKRLDSHSANAAWARQGSRAQIERP